MFLQEIEAATRELDERTYRQEFQVRFEILKLLPVGVSGSL